METKIKLKKENIIKIEIEDAEGNDTGNYLEFDLEDIELPLRIQQVQEEHKKNLNYLKMSFALINKKPDKSGKKVLSSNEEEKLKVIKTFYEKEMAILDLILGEGGTLKLLNGRKPYYEMFEDIMGYLEPFGELFEQNAKNIRDRMLKKYSASSEENNVLEV